MVRKNYTFSNGREAIKSLSEKNAAFASALEGCFDGARYARFLVVF